VVNYGITALPGVPEVRTVAYPDDNRRYFKKGDSILLLTYTNDPYKMVYDTIKVIDDQNQTLTSTWLHSIYALAALGQPTDITRLALDQHDPPAAFTVTKWTDDGIYHRQVTATDTNGRKIKVVSVSGITDAVCHLQTSVMCAVFAAAPHDLVDPGTRQRYWPAL